MSSEDWDKYWNKKAGNFIFSLFRRHIFARAVKYYTDSYFPKDGIFVEAGCGSGQTSLRISKHKRKLIAIDFSKNALNEAMKNTKYDEFIACDISKLPFKDNSIDGIWNLGVMEHFKEQELPGAINEFYRALKEHGNLIIFWATKITPYQICLDNYNRLFKGNLQLFPDEHTRLRSKEHAIQIMSKSKFKKYAVFFNWRDLFTDIVIVATK